eukprot:2741181-Amphidinium_carterae.1
MRPQAELYLVLFDPLLPAAAKLQPRLPCIPGISNDSGTHWQQVARGYSVRSCAKRFADQLIVMTEWKGSRNQS